MLFFRLQFEVLKKYLESGGDILVMLGEGGESRYDTNINFLLEEYGIMVNNGNKWPEDKLSSLVSLENVCISYSQKPQTSDPIYSNLSVLY